LEKAPFLREIPFSIFSINELHGYYLSGKERIRRGVYKWVALIAKARG